MVTFKERELLFFDPFYFPNGATPKPKFCLILKISSEEVILTILPSSKLHLPQNL
jgi:hypothetical protein